MSLVSAPRGHVAQLGPYYISREA